MLPSCKGTTSERLESDDDVSELQVALLLQMGQHSGSEEDLALTNSVQVVIQF